MIVPHGQMILMMTYPFNNKKPNQMPMDRPDNDFSAFEIRRLRDEKSFQKAKFLRTQAYPGYKDCIVSNFTQTLKMENGDEIFFNAISMKVEHSIEKKMLQLEHADITFEMQEEMMKFQNVKTALELDLF